MHLYSTPSSAQNHHHSAQPSNSKINRTSAKPAERYTLLSAVGSCCCRPIVCNEKHNSEETTSVILQTYSQINNEQHSTNT